MKPLNSPPASLHVLSPDEPAHAERIAEVYANRHLMNGIVVECRIGEAWHRVGYFLSQYQDRQYQVVVGDGPRVSKLTVPVEDLRIAREALRLNLAAPKQEEDAA